MRWRLIDESKSDIFQSLAREEALARSNAKRAKKINTLRFWISGPAAVIGRFQCSHKEVNFEYCETRGINIARRFTGGGTVYHDAGNLNFSICMDQTEHYVPRTLPELYFNFIGGIALGLQEIGVPANFDAHRSCIRIRGKKVTGTAGWIKRGVSFIHGTLLINANLDHLARALSPPKDQPKYTREGGITRCIESKRDRVTTISREVPEPPSLDEIKGSIIGTIERISRCQIERGDWTSDEEGLAEALYRTHYSKPEWNLGYPAKG